MPRPLAAHLVLLLAVGGCAAPSLPPLTAAHPASPSAAEAPPSTNPSVLDDSRTPAIDPSSTIREAR